MAITQEPKDSASNPVPHDNQIPYSVNNDGTPSLATPGARLPGHKQSDPRATMAAVSKAYQADVAAAQAKTDATFRSDKKAAQKQHTTPKTAPKPVRKGK